MPARITKADYIAISSIEEHLLETVRDLASSPSPDFDKMLVFIQMAQHASSLKKELISFSTLDNKLDEDQIKNYIAQMQPERIVLRYPDDSASVGFKEIKNSNSDELRLRTSAVYFVQDGVLYKVARGRTGTYYKKMVPMNDAELILDYIEHALKKNDEISLSQITSEIGGIVADYKVQITISALMSCGILISGGRGFYKLFPGTSPSADRWRINLSRLRKRGDLLEKTRQ